MSIRYEVHAIENSQGTGEERQFIQLRQQEPLSPVQIEKEIQNRCSLTPADVRAVMSAISDIAVRELSQGSRFHLPDIGFLSLAVGNTPPAERPHGKITGKDIYLRGINFRPEGRFLDRIDREVRFVKADDTTRSRRYAEDELWELVAAFLKSHRYITCQDMCRQFHLRDRMARKWLARFTDTGRLSKEGTRHQPLYFLKEAQMNTATNDVPHT